jgi:hypothetical protein
MILEDSVHGWLATCTLAGNHGGGWESVVEESWQTRVKKRGGDKAPGINFKSMPPVTISFQSFQNLPNSTTIRFKT